jgi:hypothetical protein
MRASFIHQYYQGLALFSTASWILLASSLASGYLTSINLKELPLHLILLTLDFLMVYEKQQS